MIGEKENIQTLRLENLAGYAEFILLHKLDEFVRKIIDTSYEINIPILKYFQSWTTTQIINQSLESNTVLLTALKDHTISEYVEESRVRWMSHQLPIVQRDDVVVEDIYLINYIRKKAFRALLHYYTTDSSKMIQVMEEVDRFTLTIESVLMNTYIHIQQEELSQANEELQNNEQKLLEAQALAKLGSFEWDLIGNKKSSYTPQMFKIFELEKANSMESFLDDVHPDDRQRLQDAIAQSMKTGKFECEYRYVRSKPKILYSAGKVIFDNDRPIKMIGTVSDVTEKAQLIKSLQESESLNKQAQALTHTGNWKWTMKTGNIDWSDEMYRIYGLEPKSEKITFERFVEFIHPDDRDRRVNEIAEAMKTGVATDYIMKIVTDSGEVKVLKGKGEVTISKDTGTPQGMIGTCQDITHEHHLSSELNKTNEELLRKNSDLKAYSFIASHDLQEPLRKIQLYSNRLVEEGADKLPDPFLNYFKKISGSSRRMQKMISDFLIFYQSMNAKDNREIVDLNEIFTEIVADLNDVILEKGASVTAGNLPTVEGIKPYLKQVFKQLIDNALKYSRESVPPVIKIKASLEISPEKEKQVKIAFKDNGIGFDSRYSVKIFELFQRLHSGNEYSGSGIGLALCKRIVEDHNGSITVDSEIGKGSTFYICLPFFRPDEKNRPQNPGA